MKKFLLLAMCALVSGLALGQDAHFEYSSNSLDFVSSTVITNVNTDQQYLVATTQTMELVVTELDPNNFLAPSNTNSKYFQIGNLICINGGFMDEDENIVVYGFIYPYKNGFIVKVEMSNGVATSLKYIKHPNANTPVVDGCWSRKNYQGSISMTYDFIVGDKFMRIDNDLSSGTNTSPLFRYLSDGSFYSVVWDDINKKHIICGNRNGKYIVTHLGIANALTPRITRAITLPTGYSFSEGTNRLVLSDIDSVVFLCHDLRYNTGDGVWISKFNYLSGQLYSSDAYQFGLQKVWMLDAEKSSDYLYILGHHNGYDNGTFERKYIAQVNMYDNTDYSVRLMSDYNLTPMSATYPFTTVDTINLLYLNNLNPNPSWPSVIASGAANGKSYAVEIYDLNYEEECDIEKSVSLYSIQPTVQSQSPSYGSSILWTPTIVTIATSTNIIYTDDVLCPSYDVLRYVQDALKNNFANKEKSLKQNFESSQEFDNENLPEISVLDNGLFVCHNFDGNCNFQIIDLSGQILYEGSTSNEKYNTVSVKANGIYIVRVVDSNGNFVSSKIAIMNY